MHPSVREFVSECLSLMRVNTNTQKVLEVGSRDVNGSVRDLFVGSHYIGIDIVGGKGVDLILNCNKLPYKMYSYNIVVCTEMLEHDRFPWKSLSEIESVLVPGGWLILTTRAFDKDGCYPMHDDPHGDYWRFTVAGLHWMLSDLDFRIVICKADPDETGVFVLAQRD